MSALTIHLAHEGIQKKCAEENADNYPLQYPLKPATQACIDAAERANGSSILQSTWAQSLGIALAVTAIAYGIIYFYHKTSSKK